MPLLDHFHQPIDPRAGWESFHHRWANAIADHLDQMLPARFFARVEVHLGNEVVTDVAEDELVPPASLNGAGGVAVAAYSPPAATITIPTVFPEEAAIEVRSADPAARLLAVIELVSPANKKSRDMRRAFVAKAVAFLQHGIGFAIVDPVTDRHFNLHYELCRELSGEEIASLSGEPSIYAASYRPVVGEGVSAVEGWVHPLAVGGELPTIPLFLRAHGFIPLDLESTYTETRRRIRF